MRKKFKGKPSYNTSRNRWVIRSRIGVHLFSSLNGFIWKLFATTNKSNPLSAQTPACSRHQTADQEKTFTSGFSPKATPFPFNHAVLQQFPSIGILCFGNYQYIFVFVSFYIFLKPGGWLEISWYGQRQNFFPSYGIVQQILLGVESRLKRSVLLNWRPRRLLPWILKGHHHERSIKPFSAS